MLYLRETCSTLMLVKAFSLKKIEFLKFSIWVYLDFLLVHNRVGPEPNPNESLQNFAQIFHASFRGACSLKGQLEKTSSWKFSSQKVRNEMGKNEVGKIFITLYCGISILSNLNGKFIPSDFITSRFFQLLFPIKCIPSFLNTPRPTVTITWPVLSSHVLLNVIFMNNMNFRRNKLE